MKKILISLIALTLIISLISCSAPTSDNTDTDETESASETDTESGTETDSQSESGSATDTESQSETESESSTESESESETKKETEPPTKLPLDGDSQGEINAMPREYKAQNYADMKCIWLSQFDLTKIYAQNGAQRDKTEFEALMATVLDNVKENGMNTVILQVRPNADSMYPSEIYPPSAYVTGSHANGFSYDPLPIIIELAKQRELSIHAWINPLRAMTHEQLMSVSKDYAIRKWYDGTDYRGKYIMKVDDNWYLNPAYSEVRDLIVKGAVEIMENYDFDGLHMDDYFYPTTKSTFDAKAYAQYTAEGGKLDLLSFRRESLNKLIASLYAATKTIDSTALFGISPAGNYNTVYNSHCADVLTWCSTSGYIDYICPQIYFGLEHETFAFKATADVWQSYIKNDSVKLIIGMTLSKSISKTDNFAGSGKDEWAKSDDILKRCLEYTSTLPSCIGVAYFCYQYFYEPISGSTNEGSLAERNNFIPLLKEISWQTAQD